VLVSEPFLSSTSSPSSSTLASSSGLRRFIFGNNTKVFSGPDCPKWPFLWPITLVGFSALAGALWWSKTVGTAWNKLQDILAQVLIQLGVRGSPQFWSRSPQKGPKWFKNGQKWHKMAKIWLWALWWSQTVGMARNELQDILAEVLAQLGVCLCGGCPKFWPRSAQKGPKLSKNYQNMTLSTLVVPNGWNGMERVTGHPGWGFDTIGGVSLREVSHILAKGAQNGPNKTELLLWALCWSKTVGMAWNKLLYIVCTIYSYYHWVESVWSQKNWV